jgi:hypothetical protein
MAARWRNGTLLTNFHSHGQPVYTLCIVVKDGRNQFLIRRLRMAVNQKVGKI